MYALSPHPQQSLAKKCLSLEKASIQPQSGFKRSLMLQIEGVSILSFYPDWMHCKALGIDKPLLGSVIWLLVNHILLGEPEANLQEVWSSIIAEYEAKDTENRYGHMRQSMFTTKSQPKLKGKAAEVKDLGPVMVDVWKKFYNPSIVIHQKILTVLEGICCEILLNCGFVSLDAFFI